MIHSYLLVLDLNLYIQNESFELLKRSAHYTLLPNLSTLLRLP